MDNPRCPYCGDDMKYFWDNNPMKPEGYFFCPKCHSQGPTAKTENEAYAAMKRTNPADVKPVVRGEWKIYGDYNDTDFEIYFHTCSICGATGIPAFNFCPNCGADMREEENDE